MFVNDFILIFIEPYELIMFTLPVEGYVRKCTLIVFSINLKWPVLSYGCFFMYTTQSSSFLMLMSTK